MYHSSLCQRFPIIPLSKILLVLLLLQANQAVWTADSNTTITDAENSFQSNPAVPYIIFSNRHELRSVDLHTMSANTLLAGLKNTVAVDFYYSNNGDIIYWTDVVDDKIYKAVMVNRTIRNITVVIHERLATAEGLAVDWIGENLYWVESGRSQIEVAKLNGSFRKTLIAGDMENPRAIALDPRYGVLFWSDWDYGAPRIEQASMSGVGRKIIFRVDSVADGAWPNGLTLDFVAHRIYLVDARSDAIYSIKYDGTGYRQILKGHFLLSHPFGISLFENYIYWTDWKTNSVIRANKWNGSDVEIIEKTILQPFGIQIVHPSRQPRDVINPCGNNNGGCSHLCLLTFNSSYQCHCPHVMKLDTDNKTCITINYPCHNWGTCSQKCKQFKFGHKCQCEPGYILEPDHFTCKSIDPAIPYIIFSNRHELRSVDLHTMSVKILLADMKNTIAVDFYHTNNGDIIYWSDVIDNKIYKAAVVNRTLRNTEVVVQRGLATPEGLAVDWIGENLYWIESDLDQIEVAKLNGSSRKTLIAGDMERPRAIALDPRYGVLFWSDWDDGAPRIERASMSGVGRKIIFRIDSVADGAWPNGITLDFVAHRIYWDDAKSDAIYSTKYDGTDHRQILKGHFLLSHPFGISLFENYIYWTDWKTNSIVRANKWNGSDVEIVESTISQPFDIRIVHPSRQARDVINPCGNNNGGCSHLCLLTFNSSYQCHCPHVMKLDTDNKTCIKNERILLFSYPNVIVGVDLQKPYYHIIPSVSQPQVAAASQIDFDAKSKKIYWSDTQQKRIRRSALTGDLIETVLDTVIENPYGFGIDWMSGNMFHTSYNLTYGSIYVCNLEGEYIKRIINIKDMMPRSLAIHPVLGKLIWADQNAVAQKIVMANMDGSELQVLISTHEHANLNSPTSLSIDFENNYLYWINGKENKTIQKMPLRVNSQNRPETLMFTDEMSSEPLAITVYKDILIYATDDNNLLHSVSKVNLKEHHVLRNNTADVMALKVYDESLQKGTNLCSENKGNCSHLCLPMSGFKRVCVCASGYHIDPMDQTKCVGKYLIPMVNHNFSVEENMTVSLNL